MNEDGPLRLCFEISLPNTGSWPAIWGDRTRS